MPELSRERTLYTELNDAVDDAMKRNMRTNAKEKTSPQIKIKIPKDVKEGMDRSIPNTELTDDNGDCRRQFFL